MALTDKLTAIADAIRAKTGGTDALTLDGMAEAVAGIEAGGGVDLAKAIVERTVTEVSDASIETVGHNAFAYCRSLLHVDLSACKTVSTEAFRYCEELVSVNLPACTTVSKDAFLYCQSMVSVSLPACSTLNNGALSYCKTLTSVDIPMCTSLLSNAFSRCFALESIDLPACKLIETNAFYSCYSLKSVILRSESMCSLKNTNAFNLCCHILGTVDATYNPEGLKDGYIYVPDALVDDYKAATNWSTYADQIKPLSEYVEVTA